MQTITMINHVLTLLFLICYGYQMVYMLLPFIKKAKKEQPGRLHRYAILICARNEEAVIGQLIESIRRQDYPAELLQVFVAADNCQDNTAAVAREAGAIVYERENRIKVGKGYALQFLLDHIGNTYGTDTFDGYFVFDADNLLDECYISRMNQTFSQGYRIVTSYRNSKNYGDNWISAGYSLWFLHDSQYLNRSRMLAGTSCVVAGTGFLFAKDVLKKTGGWTFYTLTEDTEFTIANILEGEKVGYCEKAVLYDEQPTSFAQSWKQRMRWAKGYIQVFGKYGRQLAQQMVKRGNFTCYDMLMANIPAILLTSIGFFINLWAAGLGLFYYKTGVIASLLPLLKNLMGIYNMMFVMGTVATISEWKQIHCSTGRKIGYLFTFPLFMMTYIPISFAALFKKVEWQPILHNQSKTLEQVRGGSKR